MGWFGSIVEEASPLHVGTVRLQRYDVGVSLRSSPPSTALPVPASTLLPGVLPACRMEATWRPCSLRAPLGKRVHSAQGCRQPVPRMVLNTWDAKRGLIHQGDSARRDTIPGECLLTATAPVRSHGLG